MNQTPEAAALQEQIRKQAAKAEQADAVAAQARFAAQVEHRVLDGLKAALAAVEAPARTKAGLAAVQHVVTTLSKVADDYLASSAATVRRAAAERILRASGPMSPKALGEAIAKEIKAPVKTMQVQDMLRQHKTVFRNVERGLWGLADPHAQKGGAP